MSKVKVGKVYVRKGTGFRVLVEGIYPDFYKPKRKYICVYALGGIKGIKRYAVPKHIFVNDYEEV